MLKAVFDTNIFISALITPGGKAEQVFLLAVEGNAACYTSAAILTETAKKLREKFHWNDEKIIDAVKLISAFAVVVKPAGKITVLSDEPDNRILECTRKSKADIIVTGDHHLLDLKEFSGTRILTIAEFLSEAG